MTNQFPHQRSQENVVVWTSGAPGPDNSIFLWVLLRKQLILWTSGASEVCSLLILFKQKLIDFGPLELLGITLQLPY